jgi:hypothetical protein
LVVPSQAAEFEQLQPERFEPGDHTVHSGLVRKTTRQQRILALRPSPEGREGAPHPRTEMPANAYLVVVLRAGLLTGHGIPFWRSSLSLQHYRALGERSSHTLCYPGKKHCA